MENPDNRFKGLFSESKYTKKEFSRFANEEDVEQVLNDLQEKLNSLNKSAYIYSRLHHRKSFYDSLSNSCTIYPIRYKENSFLTNMVLRVLETLFGTPALIKINNVFELSDVFTKVVAQGVAGIYIFDPAMDESFLNLVKNNGSLGDYSYGVKNDPGYFIYMLDEDCDASPTVMVDFISYGYLDGWDEVVSA